MVFCCMSDSGLMMMYSNDGVVAEVYICLMIEQNPNTINLNQTLYLQLWQQKEHKP